MATTSSKFDYLSHDTIVEVFLKHDCNKADTAKALGMSRPTLTKRMNDYPDLKEMMESAQESLIDTAESQLMKLIKLGHFPSIKFFLERKGRNRGYGQFVEVSGDVDSKSASAISEAMTVEEAAREYANTLQDTGETVDDL